MLQVRVASRAVVVLSVVSAEVAVRVVMTAEAEAVAVIQEVVREAKVLAETAVLRVSQKTKSSIY